jgi:glutathione S-transferase
MHIHLVEIFGSDAHFWRSSQLPTCWRIIDEGKNIDIPMTQIDIMAAENPGEEYRVKNPMDRFLRRTKNN